MTLKDLSLNDWDTLCTIISSTDEFRKNSSLREDFRDIVSYFRCRLTKQKAWAPLGTNTLYRGMKQSFKLPFDRIPVEINKVQKFCPEVLWTEILKIRLRVGK